MKTLLTLISLFISYYSFSQSDSLVVMIEDQLVLVLDNDFESTEFIQVLEEYKTEHKNTDSIKSDIEMVLDQAHIHYKILDQPLLSSTH